jgi:hypothetical protein
VIRNVNVVKVIFLIWVTTYSLVVGTSVLSEHIVLLAVIRDPFASMIQPYGLNAAVIFVLTHN